MMTTDYRLQTTDSNDLQIGYPLPQDKGMLTDLWQEAFHDSPEYIDLFFSRVYKPENTLVIKRNGFIISALQMIPYQVKLKSQIQPVAYICGACTNQFERGQGLMTALIEFAKCEMKKRGYAFTVLIPAEASLFNYYRKIGFKTPIYQHITQLNIDDLPINTLETENIFTFQACTKEQFPFFRHLQHERRNSLLHDEYDFDTILQEFNCCGGKAIVMLEENFPVGLAFAEKISDDTVFVREFLTQSKNYQTVFCQYLFNLFNVSCLKIRCPELHGSVPSEYGLACNINFKYKIPDFYMSLMHD